MSSLKNKLYDYEQAPPAKVWDKIAAALDDSHITDAFPAKLYNAEVAPPPSAWDKIEESLNTTAPNVVRMPQKRFAVWRYAAAAVVILGLAIFGITRLTGNSDETTSGAIVETGQKDSSTGIPSTENIATTNPKEEDTEIVAPVENDYIASTGPAPKASRRTINAYTATSDLNELEPIYAYNEHTPGLANRYVMLMTPNGIVRVSKKLGDMVCCVAGEEQDDDCKEQLKKLQEKLASSSTAHSAGNFMDILSLVSSLNENEL